MTGKGWPSQIARQLPVILLVVAVLLAIDSLTSAMAETTIQRIWRDLVERAGGPMSFRFFLQPATALILAIHDGVRDARTGRRPIFWTILTDPAKRKQRLFEGMRDALRLIILGLGMDLIYQFIVLNAFYPFEAIVITLAIAFVPYLILRGITDRVARWWYQKKSKQA